MHCIQIVTRSQKYEMWISISSVSQASMLSMQKWALGEDSDRRRDTKQMKESVNHFFIMCFSSSKRMLSFLLYAFFAEHRCSIWAFTSLSTPLLFFILRNKYHYFHFRSSVSVQKFWAWGILASGDSDQYRTPGFPHPCHILFSANLITGRKQNLQYKSERKIIQV